MGDTTSLLAATAEPEPPDECFEQLGPDGALPTCHYNGSTWQVSYDDPAGFGASSFIPTAFITLVALMVVVSIAVTVWRHTLARRMATEAGMDPDRATAMTLLTDDGLEATYLASSLRGRSSAAADDAQGRSVEERLQELQRLRDQGLVTAEEYDARRAAILDSL